MVQIYEAWHLGCRISGPGLPPSLSDGLCRELLRAQRSAGSSHQAGRTRVGSGLGEAWTTGSQPLGSVAVRVWRETGRFGSEFGS
ncbi:hypothetical protein V6N12_031696 [Hibiscus sabdariffa]|uniref:Uncharacterized protein n=1 Tax=Hibiscus sabdariffa TaxID=183260 RepID=A0ABR2DV86_9ROSI